MTDNVTQFPGAEALPENPLQMAPRPGLFSYCQHESVVLDDVRRTVQCADPKCGAVLDPFDFLKHNAQVIQRAWSAHRAVMLQANQVTERVHALKKEEQRLRAMVKRLQDKSGSVVNVRGRGL